MMSSIWENVAEHDPEIYENIKLTESGHPYCPLCGKLLRPSSDRESNNMWRCPSQEMGAWGGPTCVFIEGKFSKRQKLLWDCRYEPSSIFLDKTQTLNTL